MFTPQTGNPLSSKLGRCWMAILAFCIISGQASAQTKLVIAHHMNAELPQKAGGQDAALQTGSNTPSLPWAEPQKPWSEYGGRVRDMSLANLYDFANKPSADQAAWEIAAAQRAGIDAFAFYGALPAGESKILTYMQAAQGTGFKITLCSGGGERGDDYIAATEALNRLVIADQNMNTLLRLNGKLLLLTYGGNWGNTTAEMIAKRADLETRVGTPMLVMYPPFGMTTAAHIRDDQAAIDAIYAEQTTFLTTLLNGGFDGLSPFIITAGDERAEADCRFMMDLCNQLGKQFYQPVNFQFYSSQYGAKTTVGDTNWEQGWDIADDGADGVQLLTWNDWGETSAMAPGVNINYGLLEFVRHDAAKFKTGSASSEDKAWVMYYRYPSTSTPVLYPPQTTKIYRTTDHDYIWVKTALSASATVTCNGTQTTVPAGETLTPFPMTTGAVIVTVERQGVPILTLTPPEKITSTPWRVDHSLYLFCSDAKELESRNTDFPQQTAQYYSEYADNDTDGLLNWFEGLYFSLLEDPSQPVLPVDDFNGIDCSTAQSQTLDPVLPDEIDLLQAIITADLTNYDASFASAVWRSRYRWDEAGLRTETGGVAIFNPQDATTRDMFAFYDVVPNSTYGPTCNIGNVTTAASIKFDFGTKDANDWGSPEFALTTRVSSERQEMYFLKIAVPNGQTSPKIADVTLGWRKQEAWQTPQEQILAQTTILLEADGEFDLSLTTENITADTVRLTANCQWPDGTESQTLTADRSLSTDGTMLWGEVGFSAYLYEFADTPTDPNHILVQSFSIDANNNTPATLSDSLLLNLMARAGITNDPPVSQWADQSDVDGYQDFVASYSARPSFVTMATPNNSPAIRFNGATSNPNQMKNLADSAYDVATGESLSWSMVLKPSALTSTNDTYLQTNLTGRNYAWGFGRDSSGFHAEIRDTSGNRYTSTISESTLGALANDWMIATGVYDGAANTVQLFITDADGILHIGNLVTSASLHNGTHSITTIGTNTDRNNGAGMDLAELLIYKTALDESDRLALEATLFESYLLTYNSTTQPFVKLDAALGITNDPPVSQWDDQSSEGGTQTYTAQYSARPELVSAATPTGATVVRFNGATSNPNQMKDQTDSAYDVATGESLSWSMVLKPSALTSTNDTYLHTNLSGRNYAWGFSRDSTGFNAEVRDTNGNRYISAISDTALGALADDWMIATGVYDGAANTFQLFITDANGILHTGNLVTSASLHNGTHSITTIGANTDRNNGAGMDLAELLIYKAALHNSDRTAVETYLYNTYIGVY